MPVKIPNDLPARRVLAGENIFVMTEERATHQEIRETVPVPKPRTNEPITGFLKQLLPKNMDTGDLIIILLLLLIAGDNEENRSNALLTLALYFLL